MKKFLFLGIKIFRRYILIRIDGKATAAIVVEELKAKVDYWVNAGHRAPHLAVILVGDNPASLTYVRNKLKSCEKAGFQTSLVHLPEDVSPETVAEQIDKMNADVNLDGFIIQLPVPAHLDGLDVTERVAPAKDVDGLHSLSLGKIARGAPGYLPATPAGILELLKRYEIPTAGKHAVVIGRSQIVGTPMSILLGQKPQNCTVTLCHSYTPNLSTFTQQADLLIVAAGKPGLITGDMVKSEAVVIDVGTTEVNGKLMGDVDFDSVADKCSAITPVPGGVGPMTIASLLRNTLLAYELHYINNK